MTPKQFVTLLLPPLLVKILRRLRRPRTQSTDDLTYAPSGWETKLPPGGDGYSFSGLIARERREREPLIRRLQDGRPTLVDTTPEDASLRSIILDHHAYMTYAYVLALAAHRKQALRVLDYGGNLGDYYWIGKCLLPDVELEYHCKELPAVAEEGRKLSPQITWHVDDSCFKEEYDLVMFSASLQYVKDWHALLRRAAAAVRGYLFLASISTVERVPTFVAIQRRGGAVMLHQQLNRADVVRTAESSGRLRLVREFLLGEHTHIANAPEQPLNRGWLFERGTKIV
jgi:putative methyltransferase (TIGR04325 family)